MMMDADDETDEKKKFLASLYDFMKKRGTPILRLPQVGHKEIDLHRLYTEVTSRGGLQEIISKKLWKTVAEAFNFPSTCTNAGFSLRVNYMKYLLAYEQKFFRGTDDAPDWQAPKISSDGPNKTKGEPWESHGPPVTRRSARLSEGAAAASKAEGARSITTRSAASSASTPTPTILDPPTPRFIFPQDYRRTALPRFSKRHEEQYSNFQQLHKLVVLALEANRPSQVDWALNVLLVLSFEENVNISSVAFEGLIEALLLHAGPYFTHVHRSMRNGLQLSEGGSGDESFGSGVCTDDDRKKAIKVSEIIRNLSFIPENEVALASHSKLMKVLTKLLPLELNWSTSDYSGLHVSDNNNADQSHRLLLKKSWINLLSRNTLETFLNISQYVTLSDEMMAERCFSSLLFYLESDYEELSWMSVECLIKLTQENENLEFCVLNDSASSKQLLDTLARALSQPLDLEMKSNLLTIVLNLSKYNSKNTYFIARHETLMKRLIGILCFKESDLDEEEATSLERVTQKKRRIDEEQQKENGQTEEAKELQMNAVEAKNADGSNTQTATESTLTREGESRKRRREDDGHANGDGEDDNNALEARDQQASERTVEDEVEAKMRKKAALILSCLAEEPSNSHMLRLYEPVFVDILLDMGNSVANHVLSIMLNLVCAPPPLPLLS